MLSNEFSYPLWFFVRFLLILSIDKKFLTRYQKLLVAVFFSTVPFSYALSFVHSQQHFFLYELAIVVTFVQKKYFGKNSSVFFTGIFTMHSIGPFCKFIFFTLYNIKFPIMYFPSVLNVVIDPYNIYYSNFLFLLYPMPFLGQSDEKYQNNS